MKNKFFQAAWVTFKIWFLAVLTNTIIGSLYLSGTLDAGLLYWGTLLGVVFSFPIYLALLALVSWCLGRKYSGLVLFRLVMIAGILLTIGAWALFNNSDFALWGEGYGLLFVALLAATTGIASQYSAFFRLAFGPKKFDEYLSEIKDESKRNK